MIDGYDDNYNMLENFAIRYGGTSELKQKTKFGCCSSYIECAKAKRCVSPFHSNVKSQNDCEVFQHLCRGNIFMSNETSKPKKQAGIEGPIKEFASTLENGVQVKYHAGKNIDKNTVFVVYVKFGKEYQLLTSIVPGKKISKEQLDKWVLKKLES